MTGDQAACSIDESVYVGGAYHRPNSVVVRGGVCKWHYRNHLVAEQQERGCHPKCLLEGTIVFGCFPDVRHRFIANMNLGNKIP